MKDDGIPCISHLELSHGTCTHSEPQTLSQSLHTYMEAAGLVATEG